MWKKQLFGIVMLVFAVLFLNIDVSILMKNVSSAEAAEPEYVTVTAKGAGLTRIEALEKAWIEAVRLAVGVTISAKTEVENDQITERIVAHSRGIVESYEVLGEVDEGNRITVTIKAKIHKQTLVDASKIYGEMQVVQVGGATEKALEAHRNLEAKEKTAEEKKKTGMELLAELLDSYSPEMFYQATLTPEIFFDKEKKKYYVIISQKFNEDLFWKEFVPRLHEVLEGVAVSKKTGFYPECVRRANQELATEKYIGGGIFRKGRYLYKRQFSDISNFSYSYSYALDDVFLDDDGYYLIVPNNQAKYTAYYLDVFGHKAAKDYRRVNRKSIFELGPPLNRVDLTYRLPSNISGGEDLRNIFCKTLENWITKMDLPVTILVTFIGKNGNEIFAQPFRQNPRAIMVYRNIFSTMYSFTDSWQHFSFAPGFLSSNGLSLFLDTANLEHKWYLDEYVNDKIDQVKSMTLEVIFEK